MRAIQPVGPYADVNEARDPSNSALVVKLGVGRDSFQQNVQNALATSIAQYYGIVQDGLLSAVHCFRGLKRPLMQDDDKDADKTFLVYSWRSEVDYVWPGSRFGGLPITKIPPPSRVFVVLVKEEAPADFPGHGSIVGSIEKWNWIKEDPKLLHAPIDWEQRYEKKLWSRS
jgi:hypothetical protein